MFKFAKKLIKKNNDDNKPKFNVIAKCPKCGANLLEVGEYWSCENNISRTCNFSIKNTFNGEKIDINLLINFQAIKELSKGFENIFNESQEELKLQKDFGCKDVKKLEIGHCFNCLGPIYRIGDKLQCRNEKCGYSISTKYKGVNFSDEQMIELFCRRMSEEYDFIDENGSTTKGRVIILENKNSSLSSEYLFFKDAKDLDKKYQNRYFLPKSVNPKLIRIKVSID